MTLMTSLQEILVELLGSIPGIEQCGELPTRRDKAKLPAVFLELGELEPGNEPGTGEVSLICHLEARVIVTQKQKNKLHNLVIAVMHRLFTYDFPVSGIGKAKLKQAAPDHFSPDLDGMVVWLVEWTQEIRIGDAIWDGEGVIPESLLIGFSPDIGLGAEEAYQEITCHGS